MSDHTTDTKKEVKRREGLVFTLTGMPLFIFTILSFILYRKIRLIFPEELAILNFQYYHTITLFLLLPTFFFLTSFFILESFQRAGIKAGERFQLHKVDFQLVLQELFMPTQRKYKIRRIILIIFSIISLLLLFASQIFFYLSI